jgi:peptidoglycan hydrolase-like protein with peptidoglycan-binding domain
MTALHHRVALLACCLAVALPAASAAADAARYRLGERVLRMGAHGSDVRSMQKLLSRAGYATTADGQFGSGTRTTVRAFQRASRRAANGVVGPGTVRVLKEAAASAAAAPPPAPGDDGGVTFGTAPLATPAATDPAGLTDPAGADDLAAPPGRATLTAVGRAVAPAGAPQAVVAMIAAANEIARTPYRYGGGHGDFEDTAYDCSGSVSYALHGAGLLDSTLDSSALAKYGSAGAGRWVTIYANAEHVYMYVAGLRFDTSGQKTTGSRWQDATRSNAGFTVRHPTGL